MYLDLKLSTWEGKQKEIVALEVRIQSAKEQAKVLAFTSSSAENEMHCK